MMQILGYVGTLLLAVLLPFVVLMRKGRYTIASIALFVQAIAISIIVIKSPNLLAIGNDVVVNAAVFVWVMTILCAFAASDRGAMPAAPRTYTPTPLPAKNAFDFCKEQYEELYSSFRHFGTMRARIAWTPATVVLAAGAILLRDGGQTIGFKSITVGGCTITVVTVVAFIMVAIFALIYVADLYFVREQQILQRMCAKCESHWLTAGKKTSGDSEVGSYGDLRRFAESSRSGGVDLANRLLGLYLLSIASIPALLLYNELSQGKVCP